jgi:hypothetical protein
MGYIDKDKGERSKTADVEENKEGVEENAKGEPRRRGNGERNINVRCGQRIFVPSSVFFNLLAISSPYSIAASAGSTTSRPSAGLNPLLMAMAAMLCE